jgi:hypothetical protein
MAYGCAAALPPFSASAGDFGLIDDSVRLIDESVLLIDDFVLLIDESRGLIDDLFGEAAFSEIMSLGVRLDEDVLFFTTNYFGTGLQSGGLPPHSKGKRRPGAAVEDREGTRVT